MDGFEKNHSKQMGCLGRSREDRHLKNFFPKQFFFMFDHFFHWEHPINSDDCNPQFFGRSFQKMVRPKKAHAKKRDELT